MTKPKLTKAQEKRFDKNFPGEITEWVGDEIHGEDIETKDAIKQHLADELARQKKEIIEEANLSEAGGELHCGNCCGKCT